MKKIKLYLLLGFLTFVFLFSLFPVFVPSVSATVGITYEFDAYNTGNHNMIIRYTLPLNPGEDYGSVVRSATISSFSLVINDEIISGATAGDSIGEHAVNFIINEVTGEPVGLSQIEIQNLPDYSYNNSGYVISASCSGVAHTDGGDFSFSYSISGTLGGAYPEYASGWYHFYTIPPPAVDLTFLSYDCFTNVARFSVDDVSCDISGSGFTSVVSSLVPGENKILFYSYDSTSKILTVNFANDTPNGQTSLLYDVQTTEGLFQGSCVFDLQCVSGGDVMYRVDVVPLMGYDAFGDASAMFKVLKSVDGGVSYSQLNTISYDVVFSQVPDGGTDAFSSQDKGTYYLLITNAVDGYDIFHYVVDVDNVTLEGDFGFEIGSVAIFDDTGAEISGTPTNILDILRQMLDFFKEAWHTILALISLVGAFLGVVVNLVVFLGNAMLSMFKVITNAIVAFTTVVFDYSYSYVSLQSLFGGTLSGSVEIPGSFSLPAFSDATFLALDNALEYIVENFIHGYNVIWSIIALWILVSKHVSTRESVTQAHKNTVIGGD